MVYFTHVLGIALGIPPEKMGMNSFIIPPTKLTAAHQEATL